MNPIIYVMLLFAVALPLGLLIWWKKKTGAGLWPFLAGAICFFVFAIILERLLHSFVLSGTSSVSRKIMGSPVLYVLYGSLAAGLFEETGRLFAFKVLLRKHNEKECSIAYGIGHGGMEVLIVLGTSYALYLLASLGVQIGDAFTTAQYAETAAAIPAGMALLAMLERISAMMMHTGLSVLMFIAARKKLCLYPLCICLHALADTFPCLYQIGVIRSVPLTEAAALLSGLLCLYVGIRQYRKLQDTKQTGPESPGENDEASAYTGHER